MDLPNETSVPCAKMNLRGNIYKLQKATSKCEVIFVIFLTFVIFQGSNSRIIHVHVMEGELAQLDFPYLCNVSRVTLQYGNRAPSYSSVNPSFLSLPSNQHLENKRESVNGSCFLRLTINPVSRNDSGPYILFAYENDQYYDARVRLVVSYPPGKASCESSDPYIEGEWIRLQCSAPVGNLAGQIICYQNDIRLPPLTSPNEIDGVLSQNILALSSSSAEPIYCCSSTLQTTRDKCDCNDSGWDPIQNVARTNVGNPCSIVSITTMVPKWSSNRNESSELPKTTTAQACATDDYSIHLLGIVTVIFILIFVICISSGMLYFRFKRLDQSRDRHVNFVLLSSSTVCETF